MITLETIQQWLQKTHGVLVTKSAVVGRDTYFGRDIIALNSTASNADARGYVPVELWIMSITEADNTKRIHGEGLTRIKIFDDVTTLSEIQRIAGPLIFGSFGDRWPLTKILDIGGQRVTTSFGTEETPPIPVHTHPRKTEAYFFPPTELPPYNKKIETFTRIGLKGDVSKQKFNRTLEQFGRSDEMFTLLNEYPIEPMTGWTVLERVLHAPGPYITFEVQRPQDDYSLASWRLSERLSEEERNNKFAEHVLRDIARADEYTERILDWERTTDQELEQKYFHRPRNIESGDWGRRYQIFFDMFYGEGWEIFPGHSALINAKDTPQAGIVWSGEGTINASAIAQDGENEFLAIPGTELTVTNTGTETLYIYTVEPIGRS